MLQSTQKIIRYKVGLLNLAEELGNVSGPDEQAASRNAANAIANFLI